MADRVPAGSSSSGRRQMPPPVERATPTDLSIYLDESDYLTAMTGNLIFSDICAHPRNLTIYMTYMIFRREIDSFRLLPQTRT